MIDTAGGTASLVGESGVTTFSNGISFNGSDTFFLVNGDGEVYTVNITNGAGTSVGTLPLGGLYAHHGDFNPDTGLYYGIDATGAGPKNLVVANLSSLTFSTVTTVNNLYTLTFVPDPRVPDATPEPSAALLLGAGLFAMDLFRRKRA